MSHSLSVTLFTPLYTSGKIIVTITTVKAPVNKHDGITEIDLIVAPANGKSSIKTYFNTLYIISKIMLVITAILDASNTPFWIGLNFLEKIDADINIIEKIYPRIHTNHTYNEGLLIVEDNLNHWLSYPTITKVVNNTMIEVMII